MSDNIDDIPDADINWENIAEQKANYSAVFADLDRRQLHYLHTRISTLEDRVAALEGPRQPNGRGSYL